MKPLPQDNPTAIATAAWGPAAAPLDEPRRLGFRHVLYPSTCLWYVFVSVLDLMFTRVMLFFGGEEINVIANYVLTRWDVPGLVVYKFALVFLVICICEYVGRRRYRTGLCLMQWAVGVTWIPVLLSILLLLSTPGLR